MPRGKEQKFAEEFKRRVVEKVQAARASGKHGAVGAAIDRLAQQYQISRSRIYDWLREADGKAPRGAAPKPLAKTSAPPAPAPAPAGASEDDLPALTAALAAKLEEVSVLKAKIRALLID